MTPGGRDYFVAASFATVAAAVVGVPALVAIGRYTPPRVLGPVLILLAALAGGLSARLDVTAVVPAPFYFQVRPLLKCNEALFFRAFLILFTPQ